MKPHLGFFKLALVCAFLASCAIQPKNNPYQSIEKPATGQTAVDQLQQSAIDALQRQAYPQAIEYLQRAIKIEPRNPLSWHYLAKIYLNRKDYQRCLEMIDRSYSYSTAEDRLDKANQALKKQCQSD